MKEGEVDRACGTYWWGNLMKRDDMEDMDVDGRAYGSGG
jgi:hypothetical protein